MITYSKKIKTVRHKTLGYLYFMDKLHPLATPTGFVYYHRHVASLKIGRWVTSEEDVHHLDGKRDNNDPANLVVLSRSEHLLEHTGRVLSKPCKFCGVEFLGTQNRQVFCTPGCAAEFSRKLTLGREELERLVWMMPATRLGEQLGVTSSAIKKRCRKLGIGTPPHGYWSRGR